MIGLDEAIKGFKDFLNELEGDQEQQGEEIRKLQDRVKDLEEQIDALEQDIEKNKENPQT